MVRSVAIVFVLAVFVLIGQGRLQERLSSHANRPAVTYQRTRRPAPTRTPQPTSDLARKTPAVWITK